MSLDPKKRPSSGVCPEKFCFHWVPAGGMADMTGASYPSLQEALKANSRWTSFPEGGCACTWRVCARLDRKKGTRDFYEPCEPVLEDAGLPWFYFSTLRNLRADFHERFLKEAQAHWGAAAFEAGGVELEEAARRLHAAIKAAEVEGVRDLLISCPDAVHWRNEQGRAALHLTRSPRIIALLLDAGADIDAPDEHGFTALHSMQIAGPGETTRLLLSRGARVDVVDGDGWTPLHAAATFLLVDAVQLLLAHGADPRAKNKRGYTPLHEALDDGNERTTRFLWSEVGVRDVFLAAGLGETDYLLDSLRSEPGLVRAVDGRRRTPLHWAARCGQLDAARILLDHSADPEAREERGWTPMHWAAFGYPIQEESHGPVSFEIARLLLQHGATRSPVSENGKTPRDLLEGGRPWDKPLLAELLRGSHE